MTNKKLSIIVPVYNLEGYLANCLDSILNQDFEDYELLLINDGSKDNSGKICDHYAVKDNRIKVFHQKNAGVSAARNLGLEKANGEWICFVDGDDELYSNALIAIINEADKKKSEMIIARSFKYEDKQLKGENYIYDESYLHQTFEGYNLIVEKSYKRGSVCGCLFKNNFLKKNELYFPLGLKIGEDSIFISLVHLYVKRISFIDEIFYLVKEREGSASRSWSFNKVLKMVDNINFINNYIKSHSNLSLKQRQILDYSIYGVVSNIFHYLYSCFSAKNYLKVIKAVREELKRELDTGNISISKNKVNFMNFSLIFFSLSVLISQKIKH